MRWRWLPLLGLWCWSALTSAWGAEEYRIGVGDTLEVATWGYEDLSRTVVVRPDGYISLPVVGELRAQGATAHELARRVADALSRWVKNPRVSVIVKSFAQHQVYVLGAVRSPGAYPLQPGMTVAEAVALAEGFTASADRNRLTVLRRVQGQDVKFLVSFTDNPSREDSAVRFVLQPGDNLIVPEAAYTITGAVARPGVYPIGTLKNLEEAVATAGGTLTSGDPSRVEIQVGETVEAVNLADPSVRQRPLQAGMTIRVPERENTLFVVGEVARAGAYSWVAGRCETLMDVLTVAGGPTREARLERVVVHRGNQSLYVNVRTPQGARFPVQPYDVIVVLSRPRPNYEWTAIIGTLLAAYSVFRR
ncbi:MAG: polysaccharide biosynthesis/export family protein [Armatimonadota bacterium]|nr:polysaccharide biosynthesis/export family protein [Armatimonadota bacterium]